MAITVYDIIQMTLVACDGTVTGKTAMQKLLYFQSQLIPEVGKEIGDYVHYYYGPFSRTVEGALLSLASFDLIRVNLTSWNNNGYVYSFTDGGRKCAEKAAENYSTTYRKISEIVGKCKAHCKLRAMPLSCAAKSHYIMMKNNQKSYTTDEISSLAKKFDWNVGPDDVNNGANLLRALNLAK